MIAHRRAEPPPPEEPRPQSEAELLAMKVREHLSNTCRQPAPPFPLCAPTVLQRLSLRAHVNGCDPASR